MNIDNRSKLIFRTHSLAKERETHVTGRLIDLLIEVFEVNLNFSVFTRDTIQKNLWI